MWQAERVTTHNYSSNVIYLLHKGQSQRCATSQTASRTDPMSLYMYDFEHELENRLRDPHIDESLADVMQILQEEIRSVSPFVKMFQSGLEQIRAAPSSEQKRYRMILSADHRPNNVHRGTYNVPTVSEVAAIKPILPAGTIRVGENRDIVLRQSGGILRRIHATHRWYDALHYVLFYPYGDGSWTLELK